MPEIKHQFTGGKMNKDLDERLIPNGEYKDALNIQVSTSEGSDIGTAQNILGNSLVPGQGFIGENSICVGSIADEKNDRLYWFITSATIDMILRFDTSGIELVFVDINKDVWYSFIENIKNNDKPSVTFEDGRRALILANTAYESLEAGKAIDVKY